MTIHFIRTGTIDNKACVHLIMGCHSVTECLHFAMAEWNEFQKKSAWLMIFLRQSSNRFSQKKNSG